MGMTITDHKDMNGQIRKLARLDPNSGQKKMRAARTNIQTYRIANGQTPLIDQSLWFPRDNRATFDTRFILNQQQCSGCTGWSAAMSRMKTWFLATGQFVALSGAFIYAGINGGQDQGSVITDAMTRLMTAGTCLQSEFDLPHLYASQIPQTAITSAKQYLETLCLTVGSWLEAVTAIQMGFCVQVPIQVGNNFESFDQYGAPGYSNGSGNHSVGCDGMIQLTNSVWALTMMNTWGIWGPINDGRCLLYQKHIDGAGSADDAFAHGSGLARPPQLTA